jgi:hypothetical protein
MMCSNSTFFQARTELYNLFLEALGFVLYIFSCSGALNSYSKMGNEYPLFQNGSMFGLFRNSVQSIHNFGTEIYPANLGFGEKLIIIQYCATGLDLV